LWSASFEVIIVVESRGRLVLVKVVKGGEVSWRELMMVMEMVMRIVKEEERRR
jgi:hypothetical protein